jgi:hypothetical protein
MATISKIISLPSATQYNPTAFPSYVIFGGFTFGTPIEYGQVANGGTPTNKVGWQEPTQSFFKNKTSSTYRFRLVRSSDSALIRDGLLGSYNTEGQNVQTSLGSGLVAGTSYFVEVYTSANNGGVLYNINPTGFVAQTAPNVSPTQTGGWTIGGFAESPSGNEMSVTLNSHTTNWGGVPADAAGRYYSLELVKTDGTTAYSGILYKQGTGGTVNPAYSSENPIIVVANLGAVKNDSYRVFVKAGNRGGEATRIENPTTATNGPQTFPPIQSPSVSSISPTSGSGAGGETVMITGTSLTTVTEVRLCGILATIVSKNYTTIFATTGQRVSSTPITGDVQVMNPAGFGTKANAFTYTAYGSTPNNSRRCTSFDFSISECYGVPTSACCPTYAIYCSGAGCIY